jgi:hypothetical protein
MMVAVVTETFFPPLKHVKNEPLALRRAVRTTAREGLSI